MIRTRADEEIVNTLQNPKLSIFNSEEANKSSRIGNFKMSLMKKLTQGKSLASNAYSQSKTYLKRGNLILDNYLSLPIMSYLDSKFHSSQYLIQNKSIIKLKAIENKKQNSELVTNSQSKSADVLQQEAEKKTKNSMMDNILDKIFISKTKKKKGSTEEKQTNTIKITQPKEVKKVSFKYTFTESFIYKRLIGFLSYFQKEFRVRPASEYYLFKTDPVFKEIFTSQKDLLTNIVEERKNNQKSLKLFKSRRFYNFIRTSFQIRPSWILGERIKQILIQNKSAESIFYKAYIVLKANTSIKSCLFLLASFGMLYMNISYYQAFISSHTGDLSKSESKKYSSLIQINTPTNIITKAVDLIKDEFNNSRYYKSKILEIENVLGGKDGKIVEFKYKETFNQIKEVEVLFMKFFMSNNTEILNNPLISSELMVEFSNLQLKNAMISFCTGGFYLGSTVSAYYYHSKAKVGLNTLPKQTFKWVISVTLLFNFYVFMRERILDNMRKNISYLSLKESNPNLVAYTHY